MSTYGEFDQIWMVKSAGMVLGPFTIAELGEALRSRRVSVLDEVKTPNKRWNYAREYPELAEIIKSIKVLEPVKESTDITLDLEVTKPDWPTVPTAQSILVPLKKNPVTRNSSLPPNLNDTKKANPAPTKSNPPQKVEAKSKAPPSPPKGNQIPKQVVPDSLSPQKPASQNQFKQFALGILFALGVAGGILYYGGSFSSNSLQSVDYFSLARVARDKGLYERALQFYNKGLQQKKKVPLQTEIEFIPLLLHFPTETNSVETLIRQIENQADLTRLPVWQALLKMRQGRFTDAELLWLDLLKRFPEDGAIHLNHIVNSYFMGDKNLSPGDMAFVQTTNHTEEISVLVRGLMAARSLNAESGAAAKAIADAAIRELALAYDLNQLFRFEFLLLTATLQRNTDPEGFKSTVKALLKEDPLTSRDRIPELEVDNQIFDVGRWMDICTDVLRGIDSEPAKSVMKAECQTYNGQYEVAAQTVSQLADTPEAATVLAVSQWRLHHIPEVLKVMATRDPAVAYVRGRACLDRKDIACVEEAIKSLQSSGHHSVRSAELSIRLNLMLDKKDNAAKILKQSQLEYTHYRPFVDLQEEIYNGN